MHISAAELETTVMRAAIGAGVVYGIAIEIGKAAVALSDHGIDASTVIATALENLDRQDANGFAVDDACNGIFLLKSPVSICHFGWPFDMRLARVRAG